MLTQLGLVDAKMLGVHTACRVFLRKENNPYLKLSFQLIIAADGWTCGYAFPFTSEMECKRGFDMIQDHLDRNPSFPLLLEKMGGGENLVDL